MTLKTICCDEYRENCDVDWAIIKKTEMGLQTTYYIGIF